MDTKSTLFAVLQRGPSTDEGTFGVLSVYRNDELQLEIFMTELPWRNNAQGLSCIPSGEYFVEYMPRSASGKYKDVYHVLNVPGRSGILIHSGNFAGDKTKGLLTHSWGCLLPATRVGFLKTGENKQQKAGLASKPALNKLHEATERQSFILKVRNHA